MSEMIRQDVSLGEMMTYIRHSDDRMMDLLRMMAETIRGMAAAWSSAAIRPPTWRRWSAVSARRRNSDYGSGLA